MTDPAKVPRESCAGFSQKCFEECLLVAILFDTV